jgi:hypothetical protein
VVRIGGDDDNKPFIFLTGRLHPGESPSSIVVKGLIDFLLGDHQIAKYLVGNFVFVIVPMMCIDGVVEGFYRCSLVGDDLNRVWHAPDPVRHPVVYHTKALMREIVQRRSIEAYIDFHGHSRQHGTFVFACPNDNDGNLAHSEKLFPKLLSVLCDAFAWRKCVFSVPDEKKTASRIVVRQEIGIVQAFTLETSFGGTAGMLYDEMAWRQIGAKVAEGLYHLLARGGSPLRVMAQADLMREIERQQAARAYSQNTTGTPPIARKQVLVRRAVVSRLKRLRVARR